MLTIKTYLDKSNTHGIGLFSGEDIHEGETVWEFNPIINRKYSSKDFLEFCRFLDENVLLYIFTYFYKRNGIYYYVTDNARFMNHSEKKYNIIFKGDNEEVAARDIEKGEELLENYFMNYDRDDYFFHEKKFKSANEFLLTLKV